MEQAKSIAHLTDGVTSMVFASDGGMPELVHWGGAVGASPFPLASVERPVVGGGLDVDPPVGVVCEAARGWFGKPGLEGHRDGGRDFAPRFTLVGSESDDRTFTATLVDESAGLELGLTATLADGGVARFELALTNSGPDAYHLAGLRLGLPISGQATELLTLGGRHLFEFAQQRTPWSQVCVTVDNRHGKTSHERLGAVFAGTAGFGEQHGEVWACHLAWSGNYEFVCDAVTDGRRVLQAGELLLAGEVSLGPGETYAAPPVLAAYSGDGLNRISRSFHRYLRSRSNPIRQPRPVHLNVWEAVYFDHDLAKLKALADHAAEVGIERYVLDDGWFGSRRDDTSGLGDWHISNEVWPDGLGPLVDHVRSLGMEFGIWFEPEMVNPDSDLFREHPEWALVDHRYPVVLGRNQLVLDLGRPEVSDYLFERIDEMLSRYEIGYVKWDHNRDLVSPASRGRAGVRDQTLALYALLDRLRAAHPGVEFETCASGGGRVDFGILERTDRVWTSDSIDALDRQHIQRGFSLLFPPEVMGSHVGSARAHTTGRMHSIEFRTAAAVFGAFGVESDLVVMTDEERAVIRDLIAFHKQLRPLLHTGDVFRGDHPDPTVAVHGVLAADRSEAVLAITRLASGPTHHTAPVRVQGLEPACRYRVGVIQAGGTALGKARRQPAWLDAGVTMTGEQFAVAGFSVPQLDPESTLLLHLTESVA